MIRNCNVITTVTRLKKRHTVLNAFIVSAVRLRLPQLHRQTKCTKTTTHDTIVAYVAIRDLHINGELDKATVTAQY